MLPGIVIALLYARPEFNTVLFLEMLLGIFSTCLIASANYVINEWLDVEFDKFHPVKKNRPSVVAGLKAGWVYFEYVLLAAAGLALAHVLSPGFMLMEAIFLFMGFIYNVPPIRTKDKPYLDVLSESLNNPIRFILGWLIIIPAPLPPSSILLAY